MAVTGIEYEISVTRTGVGATQAVTDFKSVQSSAAAANAAMASGAVLSSAGITTTSNSIQKLRENTKIAHESFRALEGTLRVIGLQTFPQVTIAVTAAVDGMRALAGVAKAAAGTAGLGALAAAAGTMGGWAAIGAEIAAIAYSTWDLTKATNQMTEAWEKNDAVLESTAQHWRDEINQAVHDGNLELTDYQKNLAKINLETPTAEGLRQVKAQVMYEIPGNYFLNDADKNSVNRSRIQDQQRGMANSDAYAALNYPSKVNQQGYQLAKAQMDYNDQIKLYKNLVAEGSMAQQEATELSIEADTKRMNSLAEIKKNLTDVQQIEREAATQFASGFSQAFTDFVSGTKSAKDAFQGFAQSFLSSISQMIMQAAIMRVLFGVTGQSSGTGGLIGGLINGAAEGGMFPRMMANGGMAGVNSVSSPTYFPRFNVVAGEAGREMMTVLARPRMMNVGGMQAVVGSAQGRQLAITSAADLAGRGAGGVLDIRVTLGPELRAEIVNESVQGARVTVAQDMRTDSPISRGVKGLTA